MRLIRKHVGKEKGEKSVTVNVKKQNTKEKTYNFTLSGTTTQEIALLLEDLFILFEDKVNSSKVIYFLFLLRKALENDDLETALEMIDDAVKKIKVKK